MCPPLLSNFILVPLAPLVPASHHFLSARRIGNTIVKLDDVDNNYGLSVISSQVGRGAIPDDIKNFRNRHLFGDRNPRSGPGLNKSKRAGPARVFAR